MQYCETLDAPFSAHCVIHVHQDRIRQEQPSAGGTHRRQLGTARRFLRRSHQTGPLAQKRDFLDWDGMITCPHLLPHLFAYLHELRQMKLHVPRPLRFAAAFPPGI